MICSNCKEKMATFHSSVNINGHISEENLCSECAVLKGKIKSSFRNLSVFEDNGLEIQTCDVCGMTLDDIKENALVGCFNCYNQFSEEMKNIVYNIHGKTTHIGKQYEGTLFVDGGDL